MEKKPKYTKTVTVRFPEVIYKAIVLRAKHKQKIFGRYKEADVIRTAVVNHLKNKKYLKTGKNYL